MGNCFSLSKIQQYEIGRSSFLAQHEDPEVGSVLQQVTIQHICFEKTLEKILNAEMGNS